MGATNESGFTALGGRCKTQVGVFVFLQQITVFWTATEHRYSEAWRRYLDYGEKRIRRNEL